MIGVILSVPPCRIRRRICHLVPPQPSPPLQRYWAYFRLVSLFELLPAFGWHLCSLSFSVIDFLHTTATYRQKKQNDFKPPTRRCHRLCDRCYLSESN
jgi:hypothetical protein